MEVKEQINTIENTLTEGLSKATQALYDFSPSPNQVQIQETRKEFEGDKTIVIFPFVKMAKKAPEAVGNEVGQWMVDNLSEVTAFNVVKGFLNLTISDAYYAGNYQLYSQDSRLGLPGIREAEKSRMVEYSSPNTNKPLHLGHIRNNLLGYSVAEIMKANGHKVIKTQVINDRGIHICKSMLAWVKFGNGETPESSGIKSDHLVGKYYVEFDKAYKVQIKELMDQGHSEEEAKAEAPLMKEVREMLLKWEAKDPEVMKVWEMMNNWCYAGFDVTYKKMGVDFDKLYYESNTFLLGKELVEEGLKNEVFYQKEDGSIWCDLEKEKLDQKLVLRSDGTALYITQDIGTAVLRSQEFDISGIAYTVGDEQDYHFKVLFSIIKKLGYDWWEGLHHLSYGMVDLPSGRMKSREGTVVDADDLMEEMVRTAQAKCDEKEIGKDYPAEELKRLYHQLGMAALKYFILKVDPRKRMVYNPEESIDFNGNTGPFVQYACVRTKSVMRKAADKGINLRDFNLPESLEEKEKSMIKMLTSFPQIVAEADKNYSPAVIANYCFDLAKEYNKFYDQCKILTDDVEANTQQFRLAINLSTGKVLEKALSLLGIEVPERM